MKRIYAALAVLLFGVMLFINAAADHTINVGRVGTYIWGPTVTFGPWAIATAGAWVLIRKSRRPKSNALAVVVKEGEEDASTK